ncbi:CASP-like protein 1F2 isoform X2 [Durio zibethinus]|uniref:CASP-like protein n=1 Tax=Durio zibethinus TaxID=66656 RepID=A0A6P5YHK9_DURZI|nr:CASP-like protein 1F2 isoform X2 [Durio zibethinus]
MATEVARDNASFMLQAKSLGFPVSNTSTRSFFMAQVMLRIFAAVLTLTAICVMATSSQSIILLGFTFKAHYSYSSAMRFLLVTDAIVITVLAMSGCAAATAVGYVSRYGEEKMGWMAICNRVGKFCNQMRIAMVLSYLAFFSYFALALMSSNKVMYQASK